MLLPFHVQLLTHIIHERKLHFIIYKSVSLFSMISVYTQSFEHLNKVGVRVTMESKPEEQRYVVKFLLLELLEGEIPYHIFKGCRKVFFLKPVYPVQPFIAGFHSL